MAEFKKPAYSFYVASLVINTLALFNVRNNVLQPLNGSYNFQVFTYLTISAVGQGVNADMAFYLLAIANATSTLGRVISGLLADRFGTPRPCICLSFNG